MGGGEEEVSLSLSFCFLFLFFGRGFSLRSKTTRENRYEYCSFNKGCQSPYEAWDIRPNTTSEKLPTVNDIQSLKTDILTLLL